MSSELKSDILDRAKKISRMARNLFEDKKGFEPGDEKVFDEYIKDSEKISKKKNETELQKYLKLFLKAELKSIVDNFVKLNNVNDPNLKEKAKAFFEIFHIKFTKIFSVIFKLNRQKFLELIRVNSKTSFDASKLWSDVSIKYEYFKTHGVLNSELLKNFVKMFLTNALIQKEIQFFMMYHFDMIHDFDTSKLIVQIENYVNQPFEDTEFFDLNSKSFPNDQSKSINNVFNYNNQPLLSDVTFDNKEISHFNMNNQGLSKLNDAIVLSNISSDGRNDKTISQINSNMFGRYLD